MHGKLILLHGLLFSREWRRLAKDFSGAKAACIASGRMFRSAGEKGLIDKHPVEGVRFDSPVKTPDAIGLSDSASARFGTAVSQEIAGVTEATAKKLRIVQDFLIIYWF